MSAKLRRGAEMLISIGKLPFIKGNIPDGETALQTLKGFSPDGGRSSYLAEPVRRELKRDLSVIVPTYNNEKYVCGCVESVLSQETAFSFEVIVINDGSTDGSRDLLEGSFGKDPRVRLVHQKNKGLSGARNTGIDLARGRYLTFVDSDDLLPPGAIQALMGAAKNASMVCGSYRCRTPEGELLTGQTFPEGKVKPLGTLPGYAWGKVYRTELFDHLRFPEGYWFEDSISAQILWPLCGDACYTVPECVYEYLQNPRGISAQAVRRPKALDSLWIYMRLLEDRKSFGLSLTQEDYQYFLSTVRLTGSRTRGLPQEIKKSIFSLQIQLKNQYFSEFTSDGTRKDRQTEKALTAGSYRRYALLGELPL